MTGSRSIGTKAAYYLFPPLPTRRWPRILTLLLFFVGALAGFSWLSSPADLYAVVVSAVSATLFYGVGGMRNRRPLWRCATGIAWLVLAILHLVWLYGALVFGLVLYWSVPLWTVGLLLLLALSSLVGPRNRLSVRIPLALPLGLWILACLIGWGREDGRVRCDDYLRLKGESAVQIVVPTHSALEQCKPGHVLPVSRYPRRVWDDPTGQRILFTTQTGIFGPGTEDSRLSVELSGSVCEIPVDGSLPPRCVGRGKAEGLVESDRHDRVFVAAWGDIAPGKSGAVYALPRTGPLEILDEALLEDRSVELFYEPADDYLGIFFDNATSMLSLRAVDLVGASEPVIAPFDPGDVYYDDQRHEGLLCYSPWILRPFNGGSAALVAFQGRPFSARALASSDEYPWMWLSLVWGCQFDPEGRKAYAAIATLGLLLDIDYDTGSILRWDFIGVGMRSMVLDAGRRRIYIANFLRGDVVAIDMTTGDEVDRWFAGRFVRGLRLSRDQGSLYVGSNLGVLRVRLGGRPTTEDAAGSSGLQAVTGVQQPGSSEE